jgi:hypothetical protein
MNQNPGPGTQIKVDIDPADADGIYSNLAFLHLSPSEFILDFARIMPGPPRAKVLSRVILTPQAAKAVSRLLEVNIKKYEDQHGEIRGPGGEQDGGRIGFHTGAVPGEDDPK